MNRKYRRLIAYLLLLTVFTVYTALDTFVITRVYGEEGQTVESSAEDQTETAGDADGNDSLDSGSDNDNADNNSSSGSGEAHKGHGKGRGPGHGFGKPGSKGMKGIGHGSGSSSGSGSGSSSGSGSASASDGSVTTSDTYSDSNISVTVKEYRQNDTNIYVADVKVSSPEYLKTALAQGSYGKNVTAPTSEIAESVNAVIAVNGDYYGAQEKGYVIRNGKIYRDTAVSGKEDLVIYSDGSFGIIEEGEISAQQLVKKGAVNVLSFGPALVQDGKVSVSENEEVGKAMASNPRTSVGIIDECHYVLVVSDGRSDESEGLSLHELAQFMDSLGVETAYNLDGGGSSTMYFKGKVVNQPTTSGSKSKERSVSDIVYIG